MFYFILFHLHRLISSEKLPGIVAFYHRFYNYFWLLSKLNFCFPNFSQSLIDGKFKEFGNSRKGITMNAKNFGMCECLDAKSNIFTVFSFSIVSLLLVILNLLIKNCPSDRCDVRIHKTGNTKLKNKVANYYKYYMKKIPMYLQVVFLIIDKIIFPQPSICAPKSAIVLT